MHVENQQKGSSDGTSTDETLFQTLEVTINRNVFRIYQNGTAIVVQDINDKSNTMTLPLTEENYEISNLTFKETNGTIEMKYIENSRAYSNSSSTQETSVMIPLTEL